MNRSRRDKLKLKKKTGKMEDSQPPPNQEAITDEFNDSDFDDMDLTDIRDDSGPPPIDIAFEAVNKIEDIMNQRLYIAKAREGMAYGKTSMNLPPFANFNARCTPDLGTSVANEIFKELMCGIIEESKKGFIDRTIQALDQLLDEKKNAITNIRREAREKLGTGSKSAGTARTLLYKKLGELKDENDKKLAEFKAEIRYKPSSKRKGTLEESGRNKKHFRY